MLPWQWSSWQQDLGGTFEWQWVSEKHSCCLHSDVLEYFSLPPLETAKWGICYLLKLVSWLDKEPITISGITKYLWVDKVILRSLSGSVSDGSDPCNNRIQRPELKRKLKCNVSMARQPACRSKSSTMLEIGFVTRMSYAYWIPIFLTIVWSAMFLHDFCFPTIKIETAPFFVHALTTKYCLQIYRGTFIIGWLYEF